MSLGALLGLGGGALLSGVGSVLSSRAEEKATERQAKLLADAIAKIEGNVTTQSAAERDRALVLQRQAQRQGASVLRSAEQRADADLYNLFASPQYQAMAGYLKDAFTQGVPDVLASEYAGRLRTAQAARGLSHGGAPTQDEAALLTSLAEKNRQALLPQLRQLAFDPFQARQQAVGSRLQERLSSEGLGLQQYSAFQGGLGQAEQIAASRYGTLANTIGSLTSQMPVYGGSALGSLFSLLGGTGPGLGSLLQQQSIFSSSQAQSASQFDRLLASLGRANV